MRISLIQLSWLGHYPKISNQCLKRRFVAFPPLSLSCTHSISLTHLYTHTHTNTNAHMPCWFSKLVHCFTAQIERGLLYFYLHVSGYAMMYTYTNNSAFPSWYIASFFWLNHWTNVALFFTSCQWLWMVWGWTSLVTFISEIVLYILGE